MKKVKKVLKKKYNTKEYMAKAKAIADIFDEIARLGQDDLASYCVSKLESSFEIRWKKGSYILAEPLSPEITPVLLVAHLDTASKEVNKRGAKFLRLGNSFFARDAVLGADDRAGVATILYEVLENKNLNNLPLILFTYDEEIGGLGAREAAVDLGRYLEKKINFMVEIDRRGLCHAVFYECHSPELETYIQQRGFGIERGSYSDIATLMPAAKRAGLNLAAGYFNAHTTEEKFIVDALMPSVYLLEELLADASSIGPLRYVSRGIYVVKQPGYYQLSAHTATEKVNPKTVTTGEATAQANPQTVHVVLYRPGKNKKCHKCGNKTDLALKNMENYKEEPTCLVCIEKTKKLAVGLSYFFVKDIKIGTCSICKNIVTVFAYKRTSGIEGTVCKYCIPYISGLVINEYVRATSSNLDWDTCKKCGQFAPHVFDMCRFCHLTVEQKQARCIRCLRKNRVCGMFNGKPICHTCYNFTHEYIIDIGRPERPLKCVECGSEKSSIVVKFKLAMKCTVDSAVITTMCDDCIEEKIEKLALYLTANEVGLNPTEFLKRTCTKCGKEKEYVLKVDSDKNLCATCFVMETNICIKEA